MGIEPYVLRSGLLAILNQRLLRRLCSCAVPSDDPDARLGLAVERVMTPRRVPEVRRDRLPGTFPPGRNAHPVAERVGPRNPRPFGNGHHRTIGDRGGNDQAAGSVPAVRSMTGLTSPAEVRRVLGFAGG